MQSHLGFSSTSDGRVSNKDRGDTNARLSGRGRALFSDLLDFAEWTKQRLQIRILSEQKSRKTVNNYARRTGLRTRQ